MCIAVKEYIIFAVLLLICLAAAAAGIPGGPGRIVGGELTTISAFPFATSLLYAWNGVTFWQNCGGSVLNSRSVLTSFSCVWSDRMPSRWRMRVGSSFANSGGSVVLSSQFIAHPLYHSVTRDNDIAIVHAATNLLANSAVRAASVAGPNYNVHDGYGAYAIGWGDTSSMGAPSEQLRYVWLGTVPLATCRALYGALGYVVTDSMLCMIRQFADAGWGQCWGDEGGPLVRDGAVIVGVASWRYQCGHPSFPSVNTLVPSHTQWILNNA